MSFEIKYDRDRNPIKDQTQIIEPVQEIEPMQAHPVAEEVQYEEKEYDTQEEVADSVESMPEEEKIVKRKPSASESFRELKEAKEREERERQRLEKEKEDLARRLKEMESYLAAQKKAAEQPEEDLEISLHDEDLVEGKHLSKVDKKIKTLEKKLYQYEQQSAMASIESRLKSQYPDFDSVVSTENINILKARYPEIAYTLNASSDLYATGVSAYTMITKLGIAQTPQQKADAERIMQNAAKPRPLTSVNPQQGDSPLSKANAFANGLTDELKDQLRKEMFAARNSL